MVRILTAHRVFPAKVIGGNGIAGTSVVPDYSYKQYAHRLGGCNDIRLCIKRWDLIALNDGVVIRPGLFEAMGEQLDRGCTLTRPRQKSERSSAESTNRPKEFRHS
jgi:hypothetical protein